MSDKNLLIHLASRPEGWPTPDNFKAVEEAIPEPGEGEVLVRNIYMSVDPYMRGRMNDVKSYVPPFQIDQPLDGHAVGQVIKSRSDDVKEGDFVTSGQGWREYFVAEGKVAPFPGLTPVDPKLAPLSAWLGVLGMPGLTAYAGLLEIGQPEEGEQVFVTAASGAVGSLVGQIAKIKGCRVAGSAGSDEKVALLTDELGFDAAFNYHTDDLGAAFKAACPRGIDVYFDNVGGPQLEAGLAHMRPFGRVPVCGMIALYNETKLPPGPSTIVSVIPNRLRIQGFIVSDHMDVAGQFFNDMGQWLQEGRIKFRESIVDGLENAPQAFIDMMKGKHTGKVVVQISPDPTK